MQEYYAFTDSLTQRGAMKDGAAARPDLDRADGARARRPGARRRRAVRRDQGAARRVLHGRVRDDRPGRSRRPRCAPARSTARSRCARSCRSRLASDRGARRVGRSPRLGLVRVPPVAAEEVREGHGERPMLHLPDVAQLVCDEVVLLVADQRPPEEDRQVGRVAVEAPKPREPEEERRDDDADTRRSGPGADRGRACRASPSRARARPASRASFGYWATGSKTSSTPPC